MKLSMWILKDYLKDYNPKVYITNGHRVLQNVRILSDASIYSNANAYLGKAEDFISNEDGHIICVHDHDMMILDAKDIDAVFNRILDCFDFYNLWYDSCLQAINQGKSMQDILELSRPFFHDDICIANESHFILYSLRYPYPTDTMLTEEQIKNIMFMDKMFQTTTMPLENIMYVRKNRANYSSKKAYLQYLDNNLLPVYARNLYANQKYWGVLVLNNIYTDPGEVKSQTLDILGEITEYWLVYHSKIKGMSDTYSNLFHTVLEKSSLEADNLLQTHLGNIGWSPTAKKILFLIRNIDNDSGIYPAIIFYFNRIEGCIAGIVNSEIILLCNVDLLNEKIFISQITTYLTRTACIAGSSYPFTDITLTRQQLSLAKTAVTYGSKTIGSLNSCEKYILAHFKDMLTNNNQLFFPHPVVSELEKLDQEKGSDWAFTLYNFLLTERNYAYTAKLMSTHRNTIQYRIEKIIEQTGINLDDANIRLHIYLSLFLKYH